MCLYGTRALVISFLTKFFGYPFSISCYFNTSSSSSKRWLLQILKALFTKDLTTQQAVNHPDVITVFLFCGGRSLVWDCTCVDTFAGVHLNRSAMEAGIAANNAEERKRRKYAALAEAHQFEPIAVETMGVYGESTGVIIKAIGRRLVEATEDPREANWFRQNLAIAIQRGNAFSILSAGRERF